MNIGTFGKVRFLDNSNRTLIVNYKTLLTFISPLVGEKNDVRISTLVCAREVRIE